MTTASLSRLILKNHNTGSKAFRADYFDYLKRSSKDFVNEIEATPCAKTLTNTESALNTPVAVLNRVYQLLEPYALELNRVVSRSGFNITCTAPTFSHEEFVGEWPYHASSMVQIYRCRFASMVLSANVRVKDNNISFYVVPAEQAIRLSTAEEEVGPLMVFSFHGQTAFARFGDTGKASWWVEGKPLTDDRFERYCLLFFDYFVKDSQKLVLDRLSRESTSI